jgi:hypothetical protein
MSYYGRMTSVSLIQERLGRVPTDYLPGLSRRGLNLFPFRIGQPDSRCS